MVQAEAHRPSMMTVLARGAQALVSVDIGADPAAAIVGNPNHRMARAYPCQQENRTQATPSPNFMPQPQSKSVEPESDDLE